MADPRLLRRWARTLRGEVILPGDAAYETARLVWNRAVDRRPAAVVRCADTDDVARTIAFVREHGLPLAVRSGGHSQAGRGVCDDGLVLDLSAMRAIAVDRQQRVAQVASGARVADVMDATLAHGLVTPMGGCPDVGVGGLTLGGGENFLMGTCGAVCDNLLAADIVLADGRVLRVSGDEHADLFWAIRGGGGNFGVVTAFDYRLQSITEVLSGQMLCPVPRAAETMRRYRELMVDVPDELETSGGLTFTAHGPAFFIAICVTGERAAAERLVARWQSALQPESDNITWAPYSSDLVVPAAPSVGSGVFLTHLHDEVIDLIAEASRHAPPMATVAWNDFHGAVTRVPRGAMAFPLRDRGFDLFTTAPWNDEEGRRRASAWVDDLARGLRPFGRGVYVNNLDQDEADRVPEAFGANHARLAQIKRKYDPDNLFRMTHNIA